MGIENKVAPAVAEVKKGKLVAPSTASEKPKPSTAAPKVGQPKTKNKAKAKGKSAAKK